MFKLCSHKSATLWSRENFVLITPVSFFLVLCGFRGLALAPLFGHTGKASEHLSAGHRGSQTAGGPPLMLRIVSQRSYIYNNCGKWALEIKCPSVYKYQQPIGKIWIPPVQIATRKCTTTVTNTPKYVQPHV